MGNPHGSKYMMRDIINIWKVKQNANPSYVAFLLTNLYNILENVYSVSGVTQILLAVNEIGSKPKADAGTIFIEAGTHEITETINLANTGSMVICGHGDNTILKPTDGIPIFNITNVASVLFKNLKLDLSNYTGDTQGIIVNEGNNHHIFFENVTIIGNGANGIGIELQSNNCIIENCNITLVNIGISILSTDNIIEGNVMNSNALYGIQIKANSNSLYFNTCSNNSIGIYLNSAHYNLIDGNYCENNTNWGIYLNNSNYNSIGNYCFNNDGDGASPTGGIGIDGDSDNNILIGNTSIDNNNIGVGDGYGLYLGINTDNNYVLANYNNGNDNNFLDLGTNYTYSITGHTHDGETIQIDGINSDGGVFSFLTTGQVNFNQNVSVPNLITAGNVDGVDVSVLKTDHNNLKTDVDGFPDELKDLIQAEIQQLENINDKTISEAQWGYLGALDQALAQANSPTFAGLLLNGILNMNSHLIKNLLDPVDNQDSATKNYVLSRLLDTVFSSNWSGVTDKAITADKVYDQFIKVADEMTALKYCLNFAGIWDASSGNPPSATPSDGDYWIVTTGGTWNDVEWELLDWIVWEANSAKWYKVKYFRQFPVVEVSGNDSIQSAIDQVIHMGGGIVKIQSGTYNDSNDTFPLTINDSGNGYFLKIMGIGGSTIIDPNGDSTVFSVTNIGKLNLEDFKIDASDLITAEKEIINVAETNNNPIIIHSITIIGNGIRGYGIEINSNNCIIEDCDISSINIGINILGNDNTIRDNIINSCNTYGIQIKGNNNSFYDNETDNNGVGIYLDTADYNQINGHYIEGNTLNGIYLTGSNYNSISNNSVIENDSNTVNPQAGVYIDSDSNNNAITENSILNNNNSGAGIGYGIYIANATCNENNVKDNSLSGNDVKWKDNGTNTNIEYICFTAQDIQDAIDSIGSKSGKIILSINTFTLSATINIDGGGAYFIEGQGVGSVVDCNGDRSAFNITSTSYCELKNFKIDASDITTSNKHIIDIGIGNIHIQNIKMVGISKLGYGIYSTIHDSNIIIEKCYFEKLDTGLWINGDYNKIHGNMITNCKYGIYLNQKYGSIIDNFIFNISETAITVSDTGHLVQGNYIETAKLGMLVQNARHRIIGNHIKDCSSRILVLLGATLCDILGNTMESNSCNYGADNGAIYFDDFSDNNTIDDNVMFNNQEVGGTMYAIYINTNSDNNIIGQWSATNNDDDGISNNGTGNRIYGGESLDETFDIGKIIDGANSLANALVVGDGIETISLYGVNAANYARIDFSSSGRINFAATGELRFLRGGNTSWYLTSDDVLMPKAPNVCDIGDGAHEVADLWYCTPHDTTCASFAHYSVDELYELFKRIKPMEDGGLHYDKTSKQAFPHIDFKTLPKEFSTPASEDMIKTNNIFYRDEDGKIIAPEIKYKKGDTIAINIGHTQHALMAYIVKLHDEIKDLKLRIQKLERLKKSDKIWE